MHVQHFVYTKTGGTLVIFMYYWMNFELTQVFIPYWNFEYTQDVLYNVIKVGGGMGSWSCNWGDPSQVKPSLSPDPTLSWGEMVWWPSWISWASAQNYCDSNVEFEHPGQKSMDTRMRWTNIGKVLHNNYWSHNLIGLYRFWVISPRNLTLSPDWVSSWVCTGWARD